MYYERGQNIVEFIIILSTITIVGVFAYSLLGKNVQNLYQTSNSKIQAYKPFSFMDTNTILSAKDLAALKPGGLNGTSSSPVKQCVNGECVIDYGDLILKGIPEDFNTFVSNNGVSASKDKILGLIEQIADQLASQGDIAGAQEYRNFANLGHFMAQVDKLLEQGSIDCNSASNFASCYAEKINPSSWDTSKLVQLTLPENISDILTGFDTTQTSLTGYQNGNDLGYLKYSKINSPSTFNADLSWRPGNNIVNIYDNIISNTKYSSEIKNITTALYKDLDELNFALKQQTSTAYSISTSSNPTSGYSITKKYDPVTGLINLNKIYYFKDFQPDNILHPKTALSTDLDSALICATGKYDDTGKACK